MAAAVTPPPPFGTVLVARSSQDSPSPLELQVRHRVARLRIVDKLLGGAHLLLPGSETTIAVRAYFPKDLNDDQQQGDRGLVAFRDAFKYPIVFFILPVGPAQQKSLSDIRSFVNRAQIIMNNWEGTRSEQKEGSARVFIVPDVASAIKILTTVVQELKSDRRELKRQYYDSLKSKFFIFAQGHEPEENIAAVHVADAFRAWAERLQLPPGDADVLMSRLGSLSKIATADRTALDAIPIDESSKKLVQAFFGSDCGGQRFHGQRLPMNRIPQSSNSQLPYAAPTRSEEVYITPPPSHRTPFTGQARSGQRSPNAYETPQDSLCAMMQAGANNRLWDSTFESGRWDDPGPATQALPQLVSEPYRPRHEQACHVAHTSFNPAMQGGPLAAGHPMSRSPANATLQRLLPRFNRRSPIGNPIRPTSSYSVASASSRHPMQGYYR